ncbi:lipoprotein [Mycolicibacterium phlei]|jgi:hypothetical protein|uniref:Lipoprotein n=1 Tax=Mycolicibacterium phlei DSM 43239 = CCUG 21000 TaxID=1226750 RepID=A0A5N5UVI2_MYCPH|nr:hypothetical protein [Mycolicibacterium phlei]VEG11861.1 lipoprotein [Mycobacteroides chelonae]AMO63770.1 hypothetical protein MPHLCCUG_04985 [Mycolicibacterium phlei]KAB7753603.1 hypothetical protein MPHL21000_18375 [Mycolicibacterium phlei DSM 43239 = CCUG 21000]KXW61748.1 hypothetical protein MPHL43070_25305 [Mycolicibacterium phlei DSM 43070]KXW64573.1 hypothetical protein MPHL43072_25630 [Mycolicibacterium phlei DSM 43072]
MSLTRPVIVAAATILALGGAGVAHAEPTPAPAPPPAPKTSIDADGTYKVGVDIVPGVYASAGPIENGACYWKRTGADNKMLDNALTKKPQVVKIEATDASFTTNDCQQWQLTNQPLPPPPAAGDVLGQLGTFIGKGILTGPPR